MLKRVQFSLFKFSFKSENVVSVLWVCWFLFGVWNKSTNPQNADDIFDIFALEGEFKQWKLHSFQHHLCSQYCHNLCRNTTNLQTWWQWWACHLSIVLLTLMHAVFNIKYMLTLWSRFNYYYCHISNVSLSTLQAEINYLKFYF